MSKTFNCPSCGAPLDYDGGADLTIRCPFCSSAVIVPPELRTASAAEPPSPPAADSETRTVSQMPQWAEIARLVKDGNKIEAIKLFRSLTGAGLSESRDAVEKIAGGRAFEVANYAVVLDQADLPPPEVDRAAQIKKIGELLRRGQKIEAIKAYRAVFGVGLKEASEAVERLETTVDTPGAFDIHPPTVAPASYIRAASVKPAKRGCGPALAIAAFVVGLLALVMGCYVVATLDEYDTFDLAVVFRGTPTYTPEAAEMPTAAPPTPAFTSAPAPTSTPRLEDASILVGFKGSGPGEFENATSIGVDGEGHIYVGEYESGRVQVFDSTGEFIDQWKIEQTESILRQIAVGRDGTVYTVVNGNIYKYEGLTGKLLGKVEYGGGQGFQDVAMTAEGGLVASWNRDWRGGMFVNFNESQDDIVIFDRDGSVVNVIARALSEVAGGNAELDTRIAVDAEGNIYATGDLNQGVFKFSPDGRFVDKYADDRIRFVSAMAVDWQGRLFVAASGDILVFDADGQYVDMIDASPSGMLFIGDNLLLTIDDPQAILYSLNR